MLRRYQLGPAALVLLVAWLTGCSSTKLRDSWRDPDFRGETLRNVLVIGVARSQGHRRIFEDGFAQALQAKGTRSMASYPLLPEEGAIPVESIKEAIDRTSADAVLVTGVLRVQRNVQVTPGHMNPGYARSLYGWYGAAWAAGPPTVDQYDVLTIEFLLWDVRLQRAVSAAPRPPRASAR